MLSYHPAPAAVQLLRGVFCAAFAVLALSGCAPTFKIPLPESISLTDRNVAATTLERGRGAGGKINSWSAKADVRVSDDSKVLERFSGALIVDEHNRQLRFELLAANTALTLAVVRLREDWLNAQATREERHYSGPATTEAIKDWLGLPIPASEIFGVLRGAPTANELTREILQLTGTGELILRGTTSDDGPSTVLNSDGCASYRRIFSEAGAPLLEAQYRYFETTECIPSEINFLPIGEDLQFELKLQIKSKNRQWSASTFQ